MKFVITGVTGYIGSHVARAAKKMFPSIRIVGYARNIKSTEASDFEIRNIDVISERGINDIVSIMDSDDILIHCAWENGFNHSSDKHLSNLYGHYRLLDNLAKAGVQNINVLGTMHEIGYAEGKVSEDIYCQPVNKYGIAKNTLRQLLFNVVPQKNNYLKWLRLFYITGDDKNNQSVFTKLIEAAERGDKTFPVVEGNNYLDFIDVEEIARRIILISAQRRITGVINVCSGEPVKFCDYIIKFINDNKLNIKPIFGAYPSREGESPCIYGDTEKQKRAMTAE